MSREGTSIEGKQEGNYGPRRDRRDATEEGARSTSEAGVRMATIATN